MDDDILFAQRSSRGLVAWMEEVVVVVANNDGGGGGLLFVLRVGCCCFSSRHSLCLVFLGGFVFVVFCVIVVSGWSSLWLVVRTEGWDWGMGLGWDGIVMKMHMMDGWTDEWMGPTLMLMLTMYVDE